ncbi:hypothetical protein OUZ56_015235 [Daphnia magna]|uniref:Uncharacterized protein n=1 Tax=Daphnia magna TaxID=35525 RepID=A0ABR0AM80_9CRUS|nr:hypothetical protein OUZ56_015235 [Daphnia magna]
MGKKKKKKQLGNLKVNDVIHLEVWFSATPVRSVCPKREASCLFGVVKEDPPPHVIVVFDG